MQSPKLEYAIRGGTLDWGKEYEINMLALLSLRILRQSTVSFWFAFNVDGVGAFDDIVLRLENHTTFMLQLKHKENSAGRIILANQLLRKQNKKEFYLETYINDMSDLQTELSNSGRNIIKQLGSFNNIYFLLYTNMPDTERRNFLIPHTATGYLSHLSSKADSKIYQIDVANVSSRLGINHVTGFNNFYLFCNQINAKAVPDEIEEEIKGITGSNNSKTVCLGYIQFITEWSRGNNTGSNYCLTRSDIVSKLTELSVKEYEMKIFKEPYTFYESKQKSVWNKIIKDKIVTVIDENQHTSTFISKFLFEYIGSEVEKFCKGMGKANWSDSLSQAEELLFDGKSAKFELEDLKSVGSCTRITLYDVYKYLCKLRQLPLLLKINSQEEYDRISHLLKLFDYSYKIIILNKSGMSITLNEEVSHFKNLQNLDCEHKEVILNQQIRFQGRSGAKFKDLVDETMNKKIKVADIVNILLDNYNIGKELEAVPNYYIPRKFSNALSYDLLKHTTDDVFFIEDRGEFCKDFANKENLQILYLNDSCLGNVQDYCIIVGKEQKEFETIKYCGRNVHHLVSDNIGYLVWKSSYDATYQSEEYQSQYLIPAEYSGLSSLTTLISAGPGMGKSVLMDHIAQQVSADKWVIKIDLKKHHDYYDGLKRKRKVVETSEHLNYFKDPKKLNNELENEIYESLLKKKKVIILVDGFDEISISYKTEVTDILKSFYKDKFCIFLTTRPLEKLHLEEEFKVSALELLPFELDDQITFLIKYFNDFNTVTKPVEVFSRLRTAYVNYDFVATPLHIKMIVEVYSNDDIINKSDIFDKDFDLVDLYRMFINRKEKILRDKYGSTDSYVLYKHYQSLVALRTLFLDWQFYIIEEYMSELGKTDNDRIRLLEKGGILIMDEYSDVDFSHQTFAEYLVAEWLLENLDNENEKVRSIVERVYHACVGLDGESANHPYPFLLKVFNSLLFEKSLHGNNVYHDLCLSVINGQVDSVKEMINLNSIDLDSTTDGAKRSFLHLAVIYRTEYPLLEGVLPVILENTLELDSDVFGYTPIDYTLGFKLYHWADLMCRKWPHSKINIYRYEIKAFLTNSQSFPHLQNSLLAYFAYRDIMLKKVKEHETINSYLENYASDCVSFEDTNKNISQLSDLQLYTKSNLCYEVVFGSINAVKKLLETSDYVNKRDANGYTPLHYAVYHGQIEIIDLLLSKVANANITSTFEETPIHTSIIRDEFVPFNILLGKCDVNSWDGYGNTPLHYAVMYRRLKMINLLLSKGADVNVENVDLETVLHLLALGNDIEPPKYLEFFSKSKDYLKYTEEEACEIIESLISNSANINLENDNGDTPLHLSVAYGKFKIAHTLVYHGAELNVVNDDFGHTPLHEAVIKYSLGDESYLELIHLLLSKGASVNTRNIMGQTPFYNAVQYCKDKLIKVLLLYAADVNLQDSTGSTPLHQTILTHRDLDITKLLLLNGADVNIKDIDGNTPLKYAVRYDDYEMVQALLLYTADVNVKDDQGNTLLHHVLISRLRDLELTRLLLSTDANVNIQNAKGETPLHYCIRYRRSEVMQDILNETGEHVNYNQGNASLTQETTQRQDVELAKPLISKGSNVDMRNVHGETSLQYSIQYGDCKLIQELIHNEADVNVNDNAGNTPLHQVIPYTPYTLNVGNDAGGTSFNITMLKRKMLDKMISTLLSNGADANITNLNKETPLHISVRYNDHPTAEMLIRQKVNANAQDVAGNTPLHYSAILHSNSNTDILNLLLSNGAREDIKNLEEKTPFDCLK